MLFCNDYVDLKASPCSPTPRHGRESPLRQRRRYKEYSWLQSRGIQLFAEIPVGPYRQRLGLPDPRQL